jgi:hydroxyacylglutathione hydrolase
VHRFDDFIVYNEPRRADQLKLVGRGLAYKVRTAVAPPRAARG